MILHHLASGILNHKTSIFIFLIKFNVWELGLKSWNGCPRKVSSPRMEALGGLSLDSADWEVSTVTPASWGISLVVVPCMPGLWGISLVVVPGVSGHLGNFLSCSPRCASPFEVEFFETATKVNCLFW
ncbi:hypothetical protein L6452_30679 [Arctium lappa]|uniref:Uncharacterized protein n=1 Tax=Arctium lappa TaxID=4217 RepID=A0ACB8ZJT2_ARCLA|nr:hypothetical protein L6452_30679 [Arctium lappa]